MQILRLHAFAYLSNVFSPVWDLPPLDGKILKRRGGPFYPALQNDLDRLVGMGIAMISGVGHLQDDEGRWRLEGSYRLNYRFAEPILSTLAEFKEESRLCVFIFELGYALSALSDDDLDWVVSEDATYSDPMTSIDNVVNFEKERSKSFSASAAKYFDQVMPVGSASPGEKLHLYVRHLRWRINDRR